MVVAFAILGAPGGSIFPEWNPAMKLKRSWTIVAITSATLGATQGVPFSQHGTVSQRVSHTTIDIEYNRPVARGRELFGALVKWDSVWHPGADSASRIRFDKDVVLQDKPLAKGEYSLWLIPRQGAPWTLILSSAAHVFHQPYPGPGHDALRVDIVPEKGTHMEAMAFYFPVVGRDSVILRMHWGETMLPIRIKVSRDP
jgi:hypothetical protein